MMYTPSIYLNKDNKYVANDRYKYMSPNGWIFNYYEYTNEESVLIDLLIFNGEGAYINSFGQIKSAYGRLDLIFYEKVCKSGNFCDIDIIDQTREQSNWSNKKIIGNGNALME